MDATILEDAVAPDELVAGEIYAAPDDSQAYGQLLGMTVLGDAQLLGRTQLEDGGHAIAITPISSHHAQPNVMGTISIGADFFATAKNDYADWREKWFREAIQNSVDAGATRVDIKISYLDPDRQVIAGTGVHGFTAITVTDNGSGMDEDVLINKFLVLGGTGKKAHGLVGGFGKAKELLLLPWVSWSVRTRDLRVHGHGIQYDVEPTPFEHGTTIEVVMAADDCTNVEAATSFIRKCFLPGVRFTVNDETIKAALKVGDKIRELPGQYEVFYEKKTRLADSAMLVRAHGIYMHERYLSSDVPGTVIVEITGRSVDVLNANRDGFRDYSIRNSLDALQNELASNTISALKKRGNLMRERFVGTGGFRAALAAAVESIGNMNPEGWVKGKRLPALRLPALSPGQVDRLLDGLTSVGQIADDDDGSGINLRPTAESVRAIAQTPMLGPAHVEALTRQCAWTPDFFIVNEEEEFRVPVAFRPAKMSPSLRKLARFWAELCRFVLVQLNCGKEYGVGWIFSSAIAAHLREHDMDWLLLNPATDMSRVLLHGRTEIYKLSDPDDVKMLYAAAVHEATHMADGITYHNESFTSALTRNFAITANRGREIEAIRRSVVAR